MVLHHIGLVNSGNNTPVNIHIRGSKIAEVSTTNISQGDLHLRFENAIAFPGLINSHDHLDFNLFPQLGNRFYRSYTEWGRYIHQYHTAEISRVLKVPVLLREQWGVIKNLLCGVTTVVNHGERVKITDPLINIHEQYHCLHSVQFEKRWKTKLNHPLKRNLPVVIHVGEGTDRAAHREIDQLIHWNFFRKSLVGVHGVAMSEKQAAQFKALIWCPQSNYFLLNETAPVNKLKKHTAILFGTDSTLTGNWNIWKHIRVARDTKMLSDSALYDTLFSNPATVWELPPGEIKPGHTADLVVAKIKNNESHINAFFAIQPADLLLVVHQGNIRLFDESLSQQLHGIDLSRFSRVHLNGTRKYVQGDVPALIKHIQQYYPEAPFPITTD